MNVTRSRRGRLIAFGAVLALTAAAATACGGGVGTGTAANGMLTVTTGSTGTFTRNFNPFSPNCLQATHGMIYEPLFLFNAVRTGDIQPWLGRSYQWSDGGKALHITIRTDATWNDGKPFTNEDVAYTFRLALDKDFNPYALPLTAVTTDGTDGVTLKFSRSAYTKAYFILGKVDQLPEHVWSRIPDAKKKTFLNPNPVGTGAWTVKSVAGMSMDLAARKGYYIAGLPRMKTLRYLSFSGNNSANAAITSGKTDWAGGFIPDIQKNYLARNPEFDLVNIPLAVDFLVPNTRTGPTADVNVRKAISAAIDRDFISKTIYSGQVGPANPTGLLLPNYDAVLDPSLKGAAFETGKAKADAYLTAAGYAKGSDGIYAKDGKKLSISLQTVAGWTDYISLAQMAKQQLAAAGIELTVRAEAYAQFAANQSTGDFQMILSSYGYTPDPYAYYDELLDSRIAPKDGKSETVGNYGGYADPAVDKALDSIAATDDLNEQKPYYYAIEQRFIKDMPLIPLFNAQNEAEFNGEDITGYPTQDDPYAASAVWLAPDSGWVAARIHPVAGRRK